jgi:hypothetical protein
MSGKAAFYNLHLCVSRLVSAAERGMIRLLIITTTVLILAGCSGDDPETQFAACKMEAMRLWPNEDASASYRRPGEGTNPVGTFGIVRNHIDEYIPTCMEAHGYQINISPDGCLSSLEFHMQSACYETSTQYWFERFWDRVKSWTGA